MEHLCDACGFNLANRKCSGCSKAWYCSQKCQKEFWVLHKFACREEDLTTADYLALACIQGAIPTHEQTTIDYGFQRAFTVENQTYLLGLYVGLLLYGRISPKTVHHWRKKGVLISKIKNYFENIPPYNRGLYYPWFLQNQWVLDGKTPEELGIKGPAEQLEQRDDSDVMTRPCVTQPPVLQTQISNEPYGLGPPPYTLPADFVYQTFHFTAVVLVLTQVIFAHEQSLIPIYSLGPTSEWLDETILVTIVASAVQPIDISFGWNLLAAALVLTLAPNATYWISVWTSIYKDPILGPAVAHVAALGPAVFLLATSIVQMRASNTGDIHIIVKLARGGLAFITATLLNKYCWSTILNLHETSDNQTVLPVGCYAALIVSWIVKKSWTIQQGENSLKAGWVYSGGSLTMATSEIITKWPVEKTKCYQLYYLLLAGIHPAHHVPELWIPFGFCTCKDIEDEIDLARHYWQLVRSYSFEETYAAFASSRLYDLFLAQGLGPELQRRHPLLRDVLSTPLTMHHSVWDLKQFIFLGSFIFWGSDKEHSKFLCPPYNSVMVDYGFCNCKTEDEFDALKAIYTTLFKKMNAQPPEFHRACLEGKLYDFVAKRINITSKNKKKYKRLMKNPYPLSFPA